MEVKSMFSIVIKLSWGTTGAETRLVYNLELAVVSIRSKLENFTCF
jgi:hypothetical protein